jgi:hypothetical protein
MAQLKTKNYPALAAEWPQLLEDVVELIVDAVIERKISWNKVFILYNLSLKLFNKLLIEIWNLQLIFF